MGTVGLYIIRQLEGSKLELELTATLNCMVFLEVKKQYHKCEILNILIEQSPFEDFDSSIVKKHFY
uniref:Uncharacterized protein n=1 Tax=Candidozyma auris TaxID=498019 RepID=A0A0L0NY25_CANAR